MKKIVIFMFVFVLVISLVACGGIEPGLTTVPTTSTSDATSTENTTTETGTSADSSDTSTLEPVQDEDEPPMDTSETAESTTEATDEPVAETTTTNSVGSETEHGTSASQTTTETTTKPAETTASTTKPQTTVGTTTGKTESTTTKRPAETTTEPPATTHIHNYVSSIKAATCTTEGYTNHKCSCGEEYVTDKVAAIGHKYGEWVTIKESTTFVNGTAERTCSGCGKKETKPLDKLPVFHTHKYENRVVPATCTDKGYTVHTCSCGDTYTDTYTEKTAHNYQKTVTPSTCSAEGYTTYKCSCGHSYIGDKTAKAAHRYRDTVTAPTCEAKGYTTHVCMDCGSTYTDKETAAIGHFYTESVTAPTCSVKGYTTYKCTRCGNSYVGNEVAATGHQYAVISDTATCSVDGTKTEKCGVCGGEKTSVSKAFGCTEFYVTKSEVLVCHFEKTITTKCKSCHRVVSVETIAPTECQKQWMSMDAASKLMRDLYEQGISNEVYNGEWVYKKDFDVYICTVCGYADWYNGLEGGSIRPRYTQEEMAWMMASWINAERERVYGWDGANVTVDPVLQANAVARADDLTYSFTHWGPHKAYPENIASCNSMSDAFYLWMNSQGHYENIINHSFTKIGFATDPSGEYYALVFC